MVNLFSLLGTIKSRLQNSRGGWVGLERSLRAKQYYNMNTKIHV
jgi:hypothetical protein